MKCVHVCVCVSVSVSVSVCLSVCTAIVNLQFIEHEKTRRILPTGNAQYCFKVKGQIFANISESLKSSTTLSSPSEL